MDDDTAQGTAIVRLFAALREAAGTGEVEVVADRSLAEILDELRRRLGGRFTERVELAAIMVDGRPVDADASIVIPVGAEIALLPPFAGG